MPFTHEYIPDQEPDRHVLTDYIRRLCVILVCAVIVFAALGWLLVGSLLEIKDSLTSPRPLDIELDSPQVVVTVEPYIVVYPGPFNIYPEPKVVQR